MEGLNKNIRTKKFNPSEFRTSAILYIISLKNQKIQFLTKYFSFFFKKEGKAKRKNNKIMNLTKKPFGIQCFIHCPSLFNNYFNKIKNQYVRKIFLIFFKKNTNFF